MVCATHQQLPELIKQGRFREDLYYRLSEIVIKIPPLRSRQGDAELLAHAFLDRFAKQQERSLRGFKPDALAVIGEYDWPGNVREMENVIKRAVIMAEGPLISAADLALETAGTSPGGGPINLRQIREEAERKAIIGAMAQANGNVAQAASLLGITRPTLYDLLNRLNLR